MARKYVARDPRTGRRIGGRRRSKSPVEGIAALSPSPGPWQSIPVPDILPIACGEVAKIEILSDRGTWTLGRIDAIKALHKVLEKDAGEAYLALVEALEDDYPDVRIAGLKSLPSFALRRQGILLQCLSDRLLDEEEAVREYDMTFSAPPSLSSIFILTYLVTSAVSLMSAPSSCSAKHVCVHW